MLNQGDISKEELRRKNLRRAVVYFSLLIFVQITVLLIIRAYINVLRLEVHLLALALVILAGIFVATVLPILLGKIIFGSKLWG
ncbi:MAG: hypothetical protein NDP13_05895 [Crenarchaeota archaeon]|nr:hypothetical protein [Thermoproteota archaeon]MCR8454499.1 hypothetical protein [Thermoproteota archaeon]MCR8455114.1 hypothetical protein [Thermoproteota archaeon]MCR8462828.1 hypothetical protein [Thermoproteota archaeon]MCR8471123.1 hypothetical protein [Thermoproteota archaeon]